MKFENSPGAEDQEDGRGRGGQNQVNDSGRPTPPGQQGGNQGGEKEKAEGGPKSRRNRGAERGHQIVSPRVLICRYV